MISVSAALRILQDARVKVAMADGLIREANNMVVAVHAAGFRPPDMDSLLGHLDDAATDTGQVVELIDQVRGVR